MTCLNATAIQQHKNNVTAIQEQPYNNKETAVQEQ